MNAETAKELEQLEVWKQLKSEIDGLISYETKKLMTCTIEEITAVRQKIMAYQSVQNLPQNIIDRESE